jgi:hypothetical protein
VPDEHEVSEIGGTTEPPDLPGPTAWVSPVSVSPRGKAEPWRDSKKRVNDAQAPAVGIAIAVLIAVLMWTFIAWIMEQIILVTATG